MSRKKLRRKEEIKKRIACEGENRRITRKEEGKSKRGG